MLTRRASTGSPAQPAGRGLVFRGGWSLPYEVFARSRGAVRAAVLLTGTAVVALAVPAEPVDVRFRAAAVGLAPLVAAVPGVLLPTFLARPSGRLEPLRSHRLRLIRAGWLGVLIGCGWLCGWIAVSGWPGAAELSARNLSLVGGLSLLVAQWLPPMPASLPSALLLGVTVVYGTPSMSGQPFGWALLLQPERSVRSGAVAAVLLLTGAAAYVWRDGRST